MIEQTPKPDRIIVSDYPGVRLLKLMVLIYCSAGVMNITTGFAKVHAPFSVASLPASAWHPILIGLCAFSG